MDSILCGLGAGRRDRSLLTLRLVFCLVLFASCPGEGRSRGLRHTSAHGAPNPHTWKQPPQQQQPPPQQQPQLLGDKYVAYVGAYGPTYSGPYIEHPASTNASAQEGGHAYIPCTVKRLGSKSVSWIRKSDGYLLTVERDTFIGDSRFEALHLAASDTWTLHIRNVRPDDAGVYECQVSSEPKTSQLFTLHVVTPQVEIRGSPDVYVKSGSRVELQCILTDVLEEPPFIFWYFEDRRLVTADGDAAPAPDESARPARPPAWPRAEALTDGQGDDGRTAHPPELDVAAFYEYDVDHYGHDDDVADHVDVRLNRSSHQQATKSRRKPSVKSTAILRVPDGSIVSLLTVSAATTDDSGRYECRPSNLQTANVTLHVLDGEHEEPAAAVQDGANSSSSAVLLLLLPGRPCVSSVAVLVAMATRLFIC